VKDGDTIMIVPSIAGGAVIESEVEPIIARAFERRDPALQPPLDHA
jgi:hypothetical protein